MSDAMPSSAPVTVSHLMHLQALTTGAITVLVSNDTALDIGGTLYIEAVVL